MSSAAAVRICSLMMSVVILLIIGTPISLSQEGRYDAYSLYSDNPSPSPGESVEISLETGSSSVRNIRSVRWFIDGEAVEEFNDNLSVTDNIGNTPKQIVANIVYFDPSNQRRYVQVTEWIRPVIFDILWEGDSVTIPRYRGHILAGPQSAISVSANIQYIDLNGIQYTEDDFSFVWEVESEYHTSRGPGVSSIVIEKGGTYLNNTLFVRAQASLINDSGVYFEKSISIPVTEPRILVYSHTLLYGLFPYATVPRSAALKKSPVTFSLYPFYFSTSDFEKDLIQYRWFVNNNTNHVKEGRKIDVSLGGRSIPVPIRISAYNETKNLQKAEYTITVNQ